METEKSNRGIVYILTNPLFKENIVKIGITKDNVEKRIKELGRATGVPGAFSFFCGWEVDNYEIIEKIMHEAYRGVDRNTDKDKKRKEFFHVSPVKAQTLLELIASLHNGKKVSLDKSKAYTKEVLLTLEKENEKERKIAERFKFENYKIAIGSELSYYPNEDQTCVVVEGNKVEYQGQQYTLSKLTEILMPNNNSKSKYNGYAYWTYEGELLTERRQRMDEERA